jgi:hypothetical protein
MIRLNVSEARCAALFASGLRRSDAPTGEAVAEAVSRAVWQFGVRGCVGRMAQEFGDHPEAAMDRMRWVRQLAGEMPAGSAHLRHAALLSAGRHAAVARLAGVNPRSTRTPARTHRGSDQPAKAMTLPQPWVWRGVRAAASRYWKAGEPKSVT